MGISPAQPYAKPVSDSIVKRVTEKDDIDLVVHIGDISYARGIAPVWDLFMTQIEPVAAKIPYMVSIGNHEVGVDRCFFGVSER